MRPDLYGDKVEFSVDFGNQSRSRLETTTLVTGNSLDNELEAANVLHFFLHLDGVYFLCIDVVAVHLDGPELPVNETMISLLDEVSYAGKFLLHCQQLKLRSVPSLEQMASLCRLIKPQSLLIMLARNDDIPQLMELVADGGRFTRRVQIFIASISSTGIDNIMNVWRSLSPNHGSSCSPSHFSVHQLSEGRRRPIAELSFKLTSTSTT